MDFCDDGDVSSEDDYPETNKFISVEIPHDFDPKKVPTDGMEYLQLAMYEARTAKTVVTSEINFSKFDKNQTFEVELNPNCKQIPKDKLPSESWQNKTVEEFIKYREYIQPHFPKVVDTSVRYWVDKMETECPDFKAVSCLHDGRLLQLVNIIINKLKYVESGAMISDQFGTWIFAILSVIQIPIAPEMCYELRELARECSSVRYNIYKNNTDTDKDVTPLNVFICLIGKFFKQFDLADV